MANPTWCRRYFILLKFMEGKFTCLMYHYFGTSCKDKYYVTEKDFLSQIDLLKANGMESYHLGDDISVGNNTKLCLITIDDGHKSNLWAASELKKRDLQAVFYVIKDYSLNDPDYLNEKEIREISEMGHVIGVHGKDHVRWTSKKSVALIEELKETKAWIEGVTEKAVVTCSAPQGGINSTLIKLIQQEIPELKFIRTSRVGCNKYGDNVLKSICIHKGDRLCFFSKLIKNDSVTLFYLTIKYYIKEFVKSIIFAMLSLVGERPMSY